MKHLVRVVAMTMVSLLLLGQTTNVYAAEESATESSEEASLWEKIKSGASDLYDSAKEKIPEAIDTIKEKTPEVIEKAGEKIDEAQEAISNYREAQESEFWDWFENQTNTNVESSVDEEASAEASESEASAENEVAASDETVESEAIESEAAEVEAEKPSAWEAENKSAREFFEARDVVILILAGAIIFLGVAIFYAHRKKGPS